MLLLALASLLVAARPTAGGCCCGSASSRWWSPRSPSSSATTRDPVVDVARGIGAAAIGVALVLASTRAISARIAASAAVILFLVITALAVALSTVITDNVEDEAIRRYGARAETEALAPGDEAARRLAVRHRCWAWR